MVLYYIVYYILSHTLKNTANQRPGLPLHNLWYATGIIPLFFPVITCAQQFTARVLEDFSKSSSETFQLLRNHYENFRSRPTISDDFRALPKISEDFSENFFKNHKNI